MDVPLILNTALFGVLKKRHPMEIQKGTSQCVPNGIFVYMYVQVVYNFVYVYMRNYMQAKIYVLRYVHARMKRIEAHFH